MRRTPLLMALALLALSTICHPSDPATIRTKQMKFVDAYVAALHAKDFQKQMALFHPKVRQCMNDRNKPFFEMQYGRSAKGTPASNPSKVTFTALDPGAATMGAAFLPGDNFPYPVKPTFTAQLDFPPERSGSYTALLEIAEDHGEWYLAGPCPNEKGMDLFEEQQKKRAEQQARAAKLALEVKEPLLSQLQELLRDGHKIAAVRAYQKATGSDETTGVMVVESLQDQQRK